MIRKLLPLVMVAPIFAAAWLTFSAPAAVALAPDQLMAYNDDDSQDAEDFADADLLDLDAD